MPAKDKPQAPEPKAPEKPKQAPAPVSAPVPASQPSAPPAPASEAPEAPPPKQEAPKADAPKLPSIEEVRKEQEDRRLKEKDRLAAQKQEAVKAREQLVAQSQAAPGQDTENVMVVKYSERAAAAEQERIDIGKKAAEGQKPQEPPPPPPNAGTLPPDYYPVHPPVPNPLGSAPHAQTTPAGPMGEDIRYETDDIEPDGTPLIKGSAQEFVEGKPDYDGESDRVYNEGGRRWQHSPAEQVGDAQQEGGLVPRINQHSPEGAKLDEIKEQRPVEYVPTEATLDPKSGKGTV